jgi:hypothetical protein
MPLSRLENFLKNAEGNILYVNPSDFDATDSYENKGNSLARPFKTIQRAIIESARFSYQVGRNNDKIDKTTILVYPGTHYIDNRPGFALKSDATLYKRTGSGSGATWTTSGATITELGSSFNTDIFNANNDLYKANSCFGGIIIPRGTSIIGIDLRKTKIRPLYVPDPLDDYIENSSIFNVTGTCYFSTFSFLDGDPTKSVYKNYTDTAFVPNFSHHKLTAFVYADGVNQVKLGTTETGLTDLEMYYYKVGLIYGTASGRSLADYPTGVDFEPSVDEYRIVGNLSANPIGITSIRAGDGISPTQTITVNTSSEHGLYVDTPFLVSGVGIDTSVYNGSFTVREVVGLTTFTYTALSSPVVALPDVNTQLQNAQIVIEADSVSSASPYIFSCSLRSVYGMCGMFADGSRATGFKSMVVAQFTGISLQKDDNAFIEYDSVSKSFKNNNESSHSPLHTYSNSIYKPSYENYHIKVTNGGFIQCVSIFAIGYSRHFVSESGGDMSITNSNSNFGAVSLESGGFRVDSFDRDNTGYITHIIPPRELTTPETEVTWLSLDVSQIISVANASKLYLFAYKNQEIAPPHQIDSYRIGAKQNELLNLTVTVGAALTTYTAPILMQSPDGTTFNSKKVSYVARNVGINSITNNTFTLTSNHKFYNGEKVRVFSDNAEGPNNIELNKVYYVSTTGSPNSIKLSPTYNDAIAATPRTISDINNLGGNLTIISSVTDKQPGEFGHPIQYDTSVSSWYINSSSSIQDNNIYSTIVGLGTTGLGLETSSVFIKRKLDNRSLADRVYKLRYVIPKEATNARPPVAGYILQESSTTGIGSASILTGNLASPLDLRNPKIITNASYSSNTITVTTELPHNFKTGDGVRIQNIKSTNNPVGSASSTFNGSFRISSIPSSKIFTISGISTDPGTFTNITNQRTTNQQVAALPKVYRERYESTFFIYRIDEIKKHISGSSISGQDGIYHLTVMSSDVSPTLANVGYGISLKNFNQDVRNLYPQLDRDNYNSDPNETSSYSNVKPLGGTNVDDRRHSVTREAINTFLKENTVGYAITGAIVSGTAVTFYTDREHNLNSIKTLSLSSGGSGYGSTTLYSAELVNSSITGRNGSVKATLGGGGGISAIQIVDNGSAYSIGNTMTVSGGTTLGIVSVTSINNNIGDALQVVGVSSDGYNGVFKITGVPDAKSITVYNSNNVSAFVSRTDGKSPFVAVVGKGSSIASLSFSDIRTGIATITTTNSHGLLVGNKFSIVGTAHTIYNNSFVVKEVVGLTTITFNIGIVTSTQSYTGGGYVLRQGIAANALAIGEGEINLGGRSSYIYAGISTTLSSALSASDTSIVLADIGGFSKGDFIQINSEVLRIIDDACSLVIRGQFGTVSAAADNGTLVKKIRVIPIQFHRPSYLRASGHTFEYLGFGPGNYSTGMPQKQDRVLSTDEVIVSQAREQDGGTVVYTGMNDLGEFYSGAKKLVSVTGEEEVFDAPIFTYTGDDANTDSTKRLSGVFDDLVVRDRITVEGGENNNQTSQFYGPVNFTQKVTSTSTAGAEIRNLFLKGNTAQPKLITVGISTPTSADIPGARSGDVSFLGTPQRSGYVGHIYVDGDWRRFGPISSEKDLSYYRMDKLGIGQTSVVFNGNELLEVNGTVKMKNLYVTENVTFIAQQTFSNVAFEGITIYNGATFPGTPSTGGIAVTAYTQRHLQGISQLYNLEVVGTAATFTSANLTVQSSLNSTYLGISTFLGGLYVGFATFANVTVNGITTTNNLNVTGIVTAKFGPIIGAGFSGATSGVTTLRSEDVAGGILTLPTVAVSDTLAAKETSDIFKNKTISTTYNTISGLTNANLSGTAGITNANLANSTISGISLGGTLATLTFGTYLTGTSYNGSTGVTIATNATSSNTGSTLVARDASGNFTAGRITASLKANGLTEGVSVSGSSLTGSINIDLISNNVYYYTAPATGNWTFNFRADGGTSLDSFLSTGESITVAVLTTQGTTAYYNTAVTVDGSSVTPYWYGEIVPTSGNVSGIDMYTYVIIKTGSAAFTVIASQSQYKQ